jgi:uncharacterized protein
LRSSDFAELHIPIAEVRQGNSHFEYHVKSVLEIREGVTFSDGIDVVAEVQIIGVDFLTDIDVCGTGKFVCDRCGKIFREKIEGKVRTLFSAGPRLESEADEIRLLQATDRVLDITGDAADALVLAVPAKMLCDENCKGLCPVCGIDLNSQTCPCIRESPDSPWDGLKKIRFD